MDDLKYRIKEDASEAHTNTLHIVDDRDYFVLTVWIEGTEDGLWAMAHKLCNFLNAESQ